MMPFRTPAPRPMRRAAVVEPHTLQRVRTVDLLSSLPGITAVRSFTAMPELLAWLRAAPSTDWPHLLLVEPEDASDAMIGALDALRRAGMRVIVVSDLGSMRLARRLAAHPVDAIVSKRDPEKKLLEAVAAVRDGDPAPAPVVGAGPDPYAAAPRLSIQEERVLALYATGMPITLVAQRIGVRPDTARKYLSRVKEKYERSGRPARSKIDLARVAWEDGYGERDPRPASPRRSDAEPRPSGLPALSGAPTSSP